MQKQEIVTTNESIRQRHQELSKRKICGIYRITSPTGRIYIGSSINIRKRWKRYEALLCKRQVKIYSSLKKYGFNAHIFDIIELCSIEDLDDREEYWGLFYDVLNKRHLNLSLRRRIQIISDETRNKISIAKKGIPCGEIGKALSKEQRMEMSIKRKGVPGKPHTEESKNKIREKQSDKTDYIILPTTKNQLRKINMLTSPFKERGNKISKSKMGHKSGAKSEDHKNKLRVSNLNKQPMKVLLQYDLEGNFIKEWIGLIRTAIFFGVDKGSLSSALNKKNNVKTCAGFKWEYKKLT